MPFQMFLFMVCWLETSIKIQWCQFAHHLVTPSVNVFRKAFKQVSNQGCTWKLQADKIFIQIRAD